MKTTEQLQTELDTLKSEYKALDARSDEITSLRQTLQKEQCQISARQTQLGHGRFNDGLIGKAELKLFESKSPIYETDKYGIWRIISVDKKWIEIKRDNNSAFDSVKYHRETGWRMRSRSGDDAIDAQKALTIWLDHLTKKSVQS